MPPEAAAYFHRWSNAQKGIPWLPPTMATEAIKFAEWIDSFEARLNADEITPESFLNERY